MGRPASYAKAGDPGEGRCAPPQARKQAAKAGGGALARLARPAPAIGSGGGPAPAWDAQAIKRAVANPPPSGAGGGRTSSPPGGESRRTPAP